VEETDRESEKRRRVYGSGNDLKAGSLSMLFVCCGERREKRKKDSGSLGATQVLR
jgi:hypothetical protein